MKKKNDIQLNLLEDGYNDKMKAESSAVDQIRNRFGYHSIHLAGTKL
jgi:hypothetical protein